MNQRHYEISGNIIAHPNAALPLEVQMPKPDPVRQAELPDKRSGFIPAKVDFFSPWRQKSRFTGSD